MEDKIKKNPITFRLSDEDLEKLDILSNSHDIQKSTMVAKIVENILNENNQEFEINHISYPRPIMKKMFSNLEDKQIRLLIANINNYNKPIIESTKRVFPDYKIMNILKKSWKSYGCEVRITALDTKKILEIHHELEKNWSTVTCATISFIIGLLGNIIQYTTVEEDWFRIEYSQKD